MKQLFLPAAMSALALMTACSAGDHAPGGDASDPASEAATGVMSEAAMAEENAGFTSEVRELAFDPVSQLPKAPASAASRSECAGQVIDAKSAAARVVAEAGWGVTGEAKVGAYQLVSFAGSFEPGTSGSCFVSKGNIGVFEGTRLRAIAYARSGGKETIGRIQPFGKDGARIWHGDIVPAPIADIRRSARGLVLGKLAAEEQTCGGAVPAINDMPITRARKALIAAGWTPVNHGGPDDRIDEREQALAQLGVTEVDSCSGTGFGYCRFDYRKGKATLGVTTVGDDEAPNVSDYGVSCDR
ncbi:hypothetical protein [Novosphingobium resinovorum]|uniref:hypothetical protein n=1 Tax=Novosphingobium resinovorum TaxID=158500 RepID=UPI002ED34E0A|nr:hypothetical protein [Novosphingobium resinovorum]